MIAGDFYSYEPYGMAMWRNEADFRNLVNNGLMEAIESGKYFELYEKWFGLSAILSFPCNLLLPRFLSHTHDAFSNLSSCCHHWSSFLTSDKKSGITIQDRSRGLTG